MSWDATVEIRLDARPAQDRSVVLVSRTSTSRMVAVFLTVIQERQSENVYVCTLALTVLLASYV